jgi:uncharacterized protein YkvS
MSQILYMNKNYKISNFFFVNLFQCLVLEDLKFINIKNYKIIKFILMIIGAKNIL